jgi:uncharacterized protein YndB with AHSA1/START domain
MALAMSTRQHRVSLELSAAPERVFEILLTPSAIRGWWSASRAIVIPRAGGLWTAAWGEREDDPDYVTSARIAILDRPRRLRLTDFQYYAKTGPLPFKADIQTEFIVEPRPAGCVLTVVQDGFPTDTIADAFYAGCETGWRETIQGIRSYLAND